MEPVNRGYSPYRLVDAQGNEVRELNGFLDAQATRGLSLRSLRAYGYSLLNFWRWIREAKRDLCALQEADLLEYSRKLVERAQKGERAAFDELVDRHKGRIEALIQTRLGKDLRTDVSLHDVMQDTLLKAFVAIDRFRWQDEDSFMRWIGPEK